VTFRKLITFLTFVAVLTMAVRISVDTDTWWHLRAGETILEDGILRSDVFSLTRTGQSWAYPGWISQILLISVYRLAGIAGLNLLTGLLVMLAFAVLWHRMDAPVLFRSFVIILATAASGVYWSARPQIISFALAGVFLALLEGAQRGKRRPLLMLPVLMALWANMHGGFVIGFLLLLAYLGGTIAEALVGGWSRGSLQAAFSARQEDLRWFGLITLGCAVAVSLNPHGPQMLLYPFRTVSIGVLQDYIQEWQSPNFHHLEILPFLIMVLMLLTAFTWTGRKVRAAEYFLVLGFLPLALMAGRNIALFALAGVLPLARHGYGALEPLLARIPSSRALPEKVTRTVNVLLLILLTAAALVKISIPLQADQIQNALEQSLPVDAVSYLEENPSLGRLFNSYNWGGYVLWRLYPDYKSFVDGRTDLFDDEILGEYLQAWRADEGWEDIFAHWEIQVVLLETNAPLTGALDDSGWETAYQDAMAVVMVRPEP